MLDAVHTDSSYLHALLQLGHGLQRYGKFLRSLLFLLPTGHLAAVYLRDPSPLHLQMGVLCTSVRR